MKVWITKWALTDGIVECEAEQTSMPSLISIKNNDRGKTYVHGEGKDWHRCLLDAIHRAELMRVKKIDSLRVQVERLEKLSFDVQEAEATA